jgi:Ni/Co efflux regulator RcnB
MKTHLLMAVAALALASAPALADPGRGKGHGPHAQAAHPHGMPPGQAKKLWRRGERLPVTYIAPRYYISDYDRYDLPPPPPRYRYVYVEERVYLVDPTTRLVRDVLDVLIR